MTTNNTHSRRLECPVWHRPYLYVGKDSVEAKCRSCNEKHSVSRATLERIWSEMAEDDDEEAVQVAVFTEKQRGH